MTGIIIAPDGTIVSITGEPSPLNGIPAVVRFMPGGAVLSAPSVVPLSPVSNQRLEITLNDQTCKIAVYEKKLFVPTSRPGAITPDPPACEETNPIFLDLYLNDTLIIGGVICQNNNRIVRNSYLGFVGDLAFVDTQGNDDPQVSGLGSRWLLTYWPDLR